MDKITIRTNNIQSAIKTFSAENNNDISNTSFKINSIESHLKTFADKKYSLSNNNIRDTYSDKDKILNEHIEFQQYFNITISSQNSSHVKLVYKIDYGEYATDPKIILSTDSIIPYKQYQPKELFLLLLKEVNKIKAENKILVGLFDESMVKNLKAFTKYIYAGKFTKKIKIPLFNGIKPEISTASKLILWFKEKGDDYQIKEVQEGEVLVEYKKAKFGKHGFNAYGTILDGGASTNVQDFDMEIDESSIHIKEDINKKLYISKRQGYVHLINNQLLVNNKVSISKISRIQDALASEEVNNVEVYVSQNDTTKDSVGEGVELTSETIHINGHVGAHSVLEAVNLQLDGATHQDSTQYAKNAKINRHKGTLRCATANISLLEGGEVHATTVNIEAAMGGSIYAQDVTIGLVKNNLKVFASNSITIKRITGEDNVLKINYKAIPIIKSKIKFINEEIEDLNFDLEEAKRHSPAKIKDIKQNILTAKKEITAIKESIKTATISIEEPLKGLNIINFELENGDELIYKTDALLYKPFYLEFKEETVILQPVNKVFSLNL